MQCEHLTQLGDRLMAGGEGSTSRPENRSSIKQMHELINQDHELRDGQKASFFTLDGYLKWIQMGEGSLRPIFYLACMKCKKKVIDEGN